MKYELKQGDNAKTLKQYPDNYFDSIVTDPPYGIEFMGKDWDKHTGALETWQECFRVLKPGGHILAFSASRTYHHLATNIESVGFEIRDQIMWLYGSGFPKSMNIGKAIDKRRSSNNVIRPWLKSLGSREELAKVAKVSPRQIDHYIGENTPCPQTLTYERFILICDYYKSYPEWSDDMFPKVGKKIGEKIHSRSGGEDFGKIVGSKSTTKTEDITESATDEAKQWEGWGTALKPAHEPIVMARKPLSENTVAENVLKHNTGGINIDESRVETEDKTQRVNRGVEWGVRNDKSGNEPKVYGSTKGRYPANVMHDGSEEVLEGFPDTKNTKGKSRHEPIVMARKPLSENTVAENVLKHGTGGINIDESRVEYGSDQDKKHQSNIARGQENATNGKFFGGKGKSKASSNEPQGRFPANIIHDGSEEVLEEFPETKSGQLKSTYQTRNFKFEGAKGKAQDRTLPDREPSEGSAARFFYCSKVSRTERHIGFEQTPQANKRPRGEAFGANQREDGNLLTESTKSLSNNHPTVKPVALMKYLITLITPKGGKVLDPFYG